MPTGPIRRFLSDLPLPRVVALSIVAVGAGLLGGAAWLGWVAAGFVAALVATGRGTAWPEAPRPEVGIAHGPERVVAVLDAMLSDGSAQPCALVIDIDNARALTEAHDQADLQRIAALSQERVQAFLETGEVVESLAPLRLAVALSPRRALDLDTAMQLSGHLQRALADAIDLEPQRVAPTASIGFALASRIRSRSGADLLQAAKVATAEASRNGPAAIRSYSDAMRKRISARTGLADRVPSALANGEIRAWFQPQVSATTDAVTGVETLARWDHPERGLIPPSEFLPVVRHTGMMPALGTLMVREALAALKAWDGAGLHVPSAGVNFSGEELSDPRLVERIGWDLDGHDLGADRLVVEVLETVVARNREDLVISNLAALARLGCHLDLDDFGTGHAAITSIRQLSIGRIKIDRGFVTGIDADPDQQTMVAAILTMADRLGLDTLAEGVETEAEREMLTSLGCGHLQGFGIARPMPLEDMTAWLRVRIPRPQPVALRPTGS